MLEFIYTFVPNAMMTVALTIWFAGLFLSLRKFFKTIMTGHD